MAGGLVRRSDGRLHLRRWAVLGVVGAAVGAVALVPPPSRFVGAVLVLLGSLAFVTASLAGVVRHEMRRHADKVSETMERGLIVTLPPGRVAQLLLDRVYGPSPYNRQMVTALLGGEGREIDGGDLTVSEHTEIDLTLTTIDARYYELVIEARYSFKNRVPTSRFVIFATSDPQLRDSIISGCRLPLFEQWFVRKEADPTRFEESVEAIRESTRVGMRFADRTGTVHDVDTMPPGGHMREVKIQDWGRYLSFFGADLDDGTQMDRFEFMGRLRIFEIDLHALAERSVAVETILSLTVRSTTIQLISDGICFWQAPYPCFVERMRFDSTNFKLPAESEVRYNVKPFAISGLDTPRWVTANEVSVYRARTWMMSGHGAVFLWQYVGRV